MISLKKDSAYLPLYTKDGEEFGRIDAHSYDIGKQLRFILHGDKPNGVLVDRVNSTGFTSFRNWTSDKYTDYNRPPITVKQLNYALFTSVCWSEWFDTTHQHFMRLYDDGFKVQSGFLSAVTSGTFTFIIPYTYAPVVLFGNMSVRNGTSYDSELYPKNVTTTQFSYLNITPGGGAQGCRWIAIGY